LFFAILITALFGKHEVYIIYILLFLKKIILMWKL